MQGRSFFEVVVQLAAVLTAVPIVCVLGFTILEALGAYRSEELRIRMLTLVRDDLRATLEHERASRPHDAREKRKQALASIEEELDAHDEVAFEHGRERSEEFMARLLAAVDGPPIFAGLEPRARRQAQLCEDRLARWLKRAVPVSVVRQYRLRLAWQQMRLTAHAIVDVGWPMTSALMRRAGEHVTNGAIAGVIAGILAWSVGTRYQGRFFDYIGTGGTLGGFVGLATTAWLVIRTLRDHYRDGGKRVPGLRWSLLGLLAFAETWQLLVYFDVLL